MFFPSAFIFDRDGTLNAMVLNEQGEQDSPYFKEQLLVYPNLSFLLKPWVEQGVPFFIITNQPGMAKGHFTLETMKLLNAELVFQLGQGGIRIQEIFICPHHPVGKAQGNPEYIRDCDCRKPKAGLFTQLQRKYQIDLSSAIYIGDSIVDKEAAENAGLKNFFPVKTFISDQVPLEKRKIPFPKAHSLEVLLKELKEKFL